MKTRNRNPYDAALLLAFFITGIAGLFLPRETSSNTLLTMPTQLLYVWHSVSTIGGGLGLVGFTIMSVPRRWPLGSALLRYGLGLEAVQLTGFGLALLGLFSLKAMSVSVVLLAIAVVVWGRVVRISKDIGEFRKAFTSQMEDSDGLEHRPPGRRGLGWDSGADAAMADPEDEGGHGEDVS